MSDRPIHLRERNIPHTENSVTCPVWVTQSSLDGLHSLLMWLEGFQAAGKGQVAGHHELVMFYRTLQGSIRAHYKDMDEQEKSADEFVEIKE